MSRDNVRPFNNQIKAVLSNLSFVHQFFASLPDVFASSYGTKKYLLISIFFSCLNVIIAAQ
jgi:hypothetical protein